MNILQLNSRLHNWMESLGQTKCDMVVTAFLTLFTVGPLALSSVSTFFANHAVAVAVALLVLSAISSLAHAKTKSK